MSTRHQKFAAKTFAIGAGILVFIIAPAGIYAAMTISKSVATNPNLSSGLVGWWTFDGQNMLQNVADSSGQGNTGRLVGFTSTTTTQGSVGQALSFDGTNDSVNASFATLTPPLTATAWIYPTRNSGVQVFISHDSGVNNGWRMSIVGLTLRFTLGGVADYSCSLDVTLNAWNFVAVVASGNGGTRTCYLGSSSTSGAIGTMSGSPDRVTLGTEAFGEYFQGKIDDTRIYNRALGAAEVARLYGLGATTHVAVSPKTGLASNNAATNGLVGWWTFDGPDLLQNVTDKSGQGNNGFLSGFTSTTTIPGKIGQGLKFDGSDDRIDIFDNNALDLPQNHTISAWVKLTSVPTDGVIVHKGECIGAYASYSLKIGDADGGGTDSKINYTIRTSNAAGNVTVTQTGSPTVGEWIHIVGTQSGTTMSLYLNGVLDNTGTGNASAPYANATYLLMGADTTRLGCGVRYQLPGIIDDARVYNRVLSAAEVSRLYGLGATTHVAVTPITGLAATTSASGASNGLVGWWTFDGPNMLQNVADSSGQGNAGRLINFTSTTTVIGKLGQALKFDGVDDYVSIPQTFNQSLYSFSFWLYRTGAGGANPRIITPTDTHWVLWSKSTSNGIGFFGTTALAPTAPALNTWEHYVVVFDRAGNSAIIYKDGVSVASGAVTRSAPTGNWLLGIKEDLDSSLDMWPGRIDDVRIYNRALSAAEVLRLYQTGL